MQNNNQENIVQKIRAQYTQQQPTQLEKLRALDAKVKKPASIFACILGSVSAVIMGAGMSLVMTDIGSIIGLRDAMIPGIVIGVVGMGMALLTYPIYHKILNSRKKTYGPEILQLSESLIQK